MIIASLSSIPTHYTHPTFGCLLSTSLGFLIPKKPSKLHKVSRNEFTHTMVFSFSKNKYDVISQKFRVFFGYDVIIGLYRCLSTEGSIWDSVNQLSPGGWVKDQL